MKKINYIKINLLPYRQIENDLRRKKFLINIGTSAIIGLIISVIIYLSLNLILFNKTIQSNYLNNEIKLLKPQLEVYKIEYSKNKILKSQLEQLDQVQINRYKLYRILNDLNIFLPKKGIYLTDINYLKNNTYNIRGKAINDNLLALFMKSIPSTGLFKSVNLNEVKYTQSKENVFSINVGLVNYYDDNKANKNSK